MHQPDVLRPKLNVQGGNAGDMPAWFIQGSNEAGLFRCDYISIVTPKTQ
jgi:hypothetical protein